MLSLIICECDHFQSTCLLTLYAHLNIYLSCVWDIFSNSSFTIHCSECLQVIQNETLPEVLSTSTKYFYHGQVQLNLIQLEVHFIFLINSIVMRTLRVLWHILTKYYIWHFYEFHSLYLILGATLLQSPN